MDKITPGSSLSRRYMVAFAIMFLIFILSYSFIDSIQKQLDDEEKILTRITNQRTLVLLIQGYAEDIVQQASAETTQSLRNTLESWVTTRNDIESGRFSGINSETIRTEFANNRANFDAIHKAADCLLGQGDGCGGTSEDYVALINTNIGPYFESTQQIIDEYVRLFEDKRNLANSTELLLLIVEVISIGVIGLFLVRPYTIRLQQVISELKNSRDEITRQEATLREHRDLLEIVGQMVNVGGWVVELDTMTARWTTQTFHIHEIDPDSQPSIEDAYQFYPPEAAPIIAEAFTKAAQDGTPYDLELPFITATGKRIWVRTMAQALRQHDRITQVYGTLQDITPQKNAEIALRKSERIYRNLAANLPDTGVLIFDRDMRYLVAEGPFLKQTGHTRENTQGKTIDEVLPPATVERLKPIYERVLAGHTINFVGRRDPDENYPDEAIYEAVMLPLIDENEQIYGGMIVSRNITERVRSEEAIRQNQRELAAILNNSYQFLGLLEPDGTIIQLNRAAMDFAGIEDHGEFVGQPFWSSFWGVLSPPDQAHLQDAIQTASQGDFVQYEIEVTNKSGDTVILDFSISPVKDNEDHVLMLVPGAHNISALKAAQAAEKESRKSIQLYIEASNDGFWDWDLRTNSIFFSPRWKEMLGYEDDELENSLNMWSRLILDEDRLTALQMVQDYNAGRIPAFMATQRFHHKDDSIVYVLSRAIHLKDEAGVPYRMVGAHTDITELVRAKDAAEIASRAKSIFLANMSHELRTPLNAILGIAQLLERDRNLNPTQQDYVNIIDRSGQHLLELINEVLEMSKIESGYAALNVRAFDLPRLLEETHEILSMKAKTKNNQFQVSYGGDLPQFIVGDQGKLRQVLLNIIGNAIKFTNDGEIQVRVTATESHLQFDIRDTGIGIDEKAMPVIFNPFTQAEASTHDSEGTGLGLPISREYVRLMGGDDIHIESAPGEGTRVSFEIAYSLSHQILIDESDEAATVVDLQPDQAMRRILVVEDRYENRLMLTRLLQSVGFEVEEAVDGSEAVEKSKTWQPDLILMDIKMPGMNGLIATQEIKRSQEKPPIIIALTASVFEHQRAEILAAGCDDFIRKPFRANLLFRTLAQYLNIRYQYEDENTLEAPAPDDYSLQEIDQLPDDLHDDLLRAVTELDMEATQELIERIEQKSARLAHALRHFVSQFRFDLIREALEENTSQQS